MSRRATLGARNVGFPVLLVIAGLAAVVALSGVAAAGPAGMSGSGTSGDPYVVTNATQLQAINQSLSSHYVLGNDVDASVTSTWNGGEGFVPIGSGGTAFGGELDGDGHVVEGLTISPSAASGGADGTDAALFAETGGSAVITDLGLVDANVTGGAGGDGSDGADGDPAGSAGSSGDGGDAAGLVVTNAGLVNRSYVSDASIRGGAGGAGGDGGNSTNSVHWGADGAGGGQGGAAIGLVVTNTGTVNESSLRNTSLVGGAGGRGGDGGSTAAGGAGGAGDGGGGGTGGSTAGIVGTNDGAVHRPVVVDGSFAAGDGGTAGAGGQVGGSGDGRTGGDGGSAAGLVATNNQDVLDGYVLDTSLVAGDGGVGGADRDGGTGASGGDGGDAAGAIAANADALDDSFVGNASMTAGTGGAGGAGDTQGASGSDGTTGGLVAGNTGSVGTSYWDTEATGQGTSDGGTGLPTANTTGLAAKGNMTGFDWTGTWVTTAGYPGLRWTTDVVVFEVAIDSTTSPVNGSETLEVALNVTNAGTVTGTQTVNLTDVDGVERDNVSVTLDAWASNRSIRLNWTTRAGDAGTGNVTVRSANDTTSASVTVNDTTAPSADAGANLTVDEDVSTAFNGTASDAVGVTGYAWDFGDGNTSTTRNATHAFATPGNYTVTFNASDAAGNVGNDTLLVTVDDTTPPTAEAGSNRSVQAGTALSLDGSSSSDNAAVASYDWTFGDGGTATGSAPSHTYASQGTYTVTLEVSDAAGHTANDTLVVTVRAAPAGGGGGGGGGGFGGGGAVGGTRVTVEPLGPASRDGTSAAAGSRVSIANALADAPLSIGLGGNDGSTASGDGAGQRATDAGPIVVDRIDVTPLRDGDFELSVETEAVAVPELRTTSADGDALTIHDLSTDALDDEGRAFVDATGRRPAGFLRVDHAFPDDAVGDVTLGFRVSKSYLSATGVNPGAVQLYREEPGGWRALPTRQVGDADEYYRFSADSPGLSRFTIGATAPVFEVETVAPADLETSVLAGEPVTVAVTVDNVGSADGRFAGVLTADGRPLDGGAVAVPTGESRTLALGGAIDRAGTAGLALNGHAVASIDVLEPAASAGGPASGESTPAGDASTDPAAPADGGLGSTGGASPWVVLAIALGLLVALVVSNATLRRMDE